MRFPTYLILFAAIFTSTFYMMAVSALPYGRTALSPQSSFSTNHHSLEGRSAGTGSWDPTLEASHPIHLTKRRVDKAAILSSYEALKRLGTSVLYVTKTSTKSMPEVKEAWRARKEVLPPGASDLRKHMKTLANFEKAVQSVRFAKPHA
ncbi:hypothetical protein BC835DRAFT_1358009 [Cytidiella melzeri]|nr:hypothetical protein BC835DRAFT_1358009 [Cytidiella melzeri]